jgi:Tfp pilus assembly protein PilX
MIVFMGLGVALFATANDQQRSSYNQQSSESAYSLAEAALNAQIYQLSAQWPTSALNQQSAFPSSCNATSNGASYCPSTANLSAYPTGSQTCPAGTPGDAWSSASPTNGWTTYVRDAGPSGSGTQSLFTSATEKGYAAYDSSGTGFLWVRAVGIVNCHTAIVIAKVSEQIIPLTFPQTVLSANGFEVSDSGNKVVLNTADLNGNTSQISLRCVGLGGLPPGSTCAQATKPSQVGPGPVYASPPTVSPTLTSTQLGALKALAIANNTYIPAGTNCNNITDAQLAGAVVYIEGGNSTTPCNISITSNSMINSLSSPGIIVLVNGTITFGGSMTYYGVIYDVNKQNVQPPNTDVVTLGGTSTVVGGIDVDGLGTVSLGSSGNGLDCANPNGNKKCGDLEFAQSAFPSLTAFGGAAGTPNSFRQLPAGQ